MSERWSMGVLLTVVVYAGCGGPGAPPAAGSEAPPAAAAPAEKADSPAPPAEPAGPTARPTEPRGVVVALIEAFQAGDRAAVEALWARDGGTWRDAAGFRERAKYYQDAEFDLDPASIESVEQGDTTTLAVHAESAGIGYTWIFRVSEIDGELRAGGVETRPAGLP